MSAMHRLDGQVAIVTGGAGGIGSQIVAELSALGAIVGVCDVNYEQAKSVAATAERAVALSVDLSDADSVRAMIQAAHSELGRVDVLVNNAGVGTAVPALKETPEQFRSVVDLNLNASYWMAQACGRVMQPGSSIINISSVLALTSMGLPQAAYTASKAGVIGLTRDLAQQWTARKGIRVNAIAPGHFESEMSGQFDERAHAAIVARTVAGRLGAPGELNGALIFLASPASSYITGVVLPVDGGVLLT